MAETRFLSDYLTCIDEPRSGRRTKRKCKGKCFVIFGKYHGTSNTTQDTFYLRLCKNETELEGREDYNFTADQFCGMEVGCPEPCRKNIFERLFDKKRKYTFLKVILREQTITFRIEWDGFMAFKTVEEWRKCIMKEVAYKCSWTVYVPGSTVLGEGYGKLHLTDMRLTLTTTDTSWECLASWRLADLRCCGDSDNELRLEFQGTAEQLIFLTDQAKEIAKNVRNYMPKQTMECIPSVPAEPTKNSGSNSMKMFSRKRQSVHRNHGGPTEPRERLDSDCSSGDDMLEGPLHSPWLQPPPCYGCAGGLQPVPADELRKPCTCGHQDPDQHACLLKPNSPLAHSQTLVPHAMITGEEDQYYEADGGAGMAIYDEPMTYIPDPPDGIESETPLIRPHEKLHRTEFTRPRRSLPREEDPLHESAALTNKLARLALNDKAARKAPRYVHPDEVRQNKLTKLVLPNNSHWQSRPLPEIPKDNGDCSPGGLPEGVLPKVHQRKPKTPVDSKVVNDQSEVSSTSGSPRGKRKKPVPSPRVNIPPANGSTPGQSSWLNIPPANGSTPGQSSCDAMKEERFTFPPVPAPRKHHLRHQRSLSWDSSMKPSTCMMMGGGGLVATLPRKMNDRFHWTNGANISDDDTDEIYDINKLLRPDMDCSKRQSIQWYMNAVGLSDLQLQDGDDTPPPVPPRHNREPLNIDMEPEYESARCVYNTLTMVLQRTPPLPDTLKLSPKVRTKVCLHLYLGNVILLDWKDLASAIGLEFAAIEMISSFQVHHPNHTAAEIVLRHWQYMYNRYRDNREKCYYECTQDKLIEILTKMNRLDIVEVVTKAQGRR